MKSPVFNLKGEEKGSVELADAVFSRAWNNDLVHQVLVSLMANARRPWAHTKDRSEVAGGGKKPWRQKGTGRARHGSRRSPIWAGGGVTHGPRKEKDYSKKINKKMKKAALYSVLSKKLDNGSMKIVEKLEAKGAKTKEIANALKDFYKDQDRMPKTLIVTAQDSKDAAKAAANIKNVSVSQASALSVYKLLTHKSVIMEKAAAEELSQRANVKPEKNNE